MLSHFSIGHAQNISFDILEGRDKVEIPFEFRHNFIVLDVKLSGMLPLKFIFDTGAENTILFNKGLADVLDYKYDLRIPIWGADRVAALYALVARSIGVEVEGLPPHKLDILVLEEMTFDLSEITGVQIHGLLGGNFFRNAIVRIDYKKQVLTFYNPESFIPPSHKSYQTVPVQIKSNKPYLRTNAELLDGTTLDLRLLIDTGAGLPLMLHSNTDPAIQLPEKTILGQLGMGLGGYVLGYIGRISSLQLAETEMRSIITSFQDLSVVLAQDSITNRNGLLGNQLLARFEVILDYVNGTMYLKPMKNAEKRFKMDRSGLIIFAQGPELDQFVVQGMIEGSPAAEAGLEVGDVIIRLQGLTGKSYSLDRLTKVLQKRAGKKIKIVVRRDDEKLRFKFRLRDLI